MASQIAKRYWHSTMKKGGEAGGADREGEREDNMEKWMEEDDGG